MEFLVLCISKKIRMQGSSASLNPPYDKIRSSVRREEIPLGKGFPRVFFLSG